MMTKLHLSELSYPERARQSSAPVLILISLAQVTNGYDISLSAFPSVHNPPRDSLAEHK